MRKILSKLPFTKHLRLAVCIDHIVNVGIRRPKWRWNFNQAYQLSFLHLFIKILYVINLRERFIKLNDNEVTTLEFSLHHIIFSYETLWGLILFSLIYLFVRNIYSLINATSKFKYLPTAKTRQNFFLTFCSVILKEGAFMVLSNI